MIHNFYFAAHQLVQQTFMTLFVGKIYHFLCSIRIHWVVHLTLAVVPYIRFV